MGRGTIARRRREEEEGPMVPIATITPRPRATDEQLRLLDQSRDAFRQRVTALREHARTLTVRPDALTQEMVNQEADRVAQALRAADLTSMPVLGERFTDDVGRIEGMIRSARTLGTAGRLGEAWNRLADARESLEALGQIYEIEIKLLREGVPTHIRVSGTESADVIGEISSCLETAHSLIGTENAALLPVMIQAGNLFANHVQTYGLDEETAISEGSSLVTFMVERREQARRPGFRYTAQMRETDRGLLQQAERNVLSLERQARQRNVTVLTGWRDEIQTLIGSQESEQMQTHMRNIMRDLDDAIRRLRRNSDVSQQELDRLLTSYLMVSGRSVPASDDEREENILGIARSLRGRRAAPAEGSPEWFAQQAITALSQGDRNRAALATSLAVLERAARGSRRHASDYLPEYRRMLEVLTRDMRTSPAMLSRYSDMVDVANMTLEVERLEALTGRGAREKRERLRSAARIVRQRMGAGDLAGARRLLNMALYYQDRLEGSNWREFTGILIMETAMDSEIGGMDSSERFNLGMRYFRITQEVDSSTAAVRDWDARGMRAQRRHVDQMSAYIRGLAREGNSDAAGTAMTLLAMYVDSVERLGLRRRGRIVRISDEHAAQLRGMESSMASLRGGERDVETAFMESFRTSQQSSIEQEITRLESLASRRTAGRDIIQRALQAARQRAQRGETRGANLLLRFVQDYYGAAGDGRGEGWRYTLSTTAVGEAGVPRAYQRGRRQMLQAIEMEMQARTEDQHQTAARHYDRATRRIAQAETLIADYNRLLAISEGRQPVMEGVEAGRIPLGERREDGSFPAYIQSSAVFGYEAAHQHDTAIWSGDARTDRQSTLAARLAQLREAAFEGNLSQYQRTFTGFSQRLSLISARAHRSGTITEARSMLTQGRQALRDAFIVYAVELLSEGGAQDGAARFRQLEEQSRRAVYRTEDRTSPSMRSVRIRVFDRYERPSLRTLYTELQTLYPNQTELLGRLSGLVQYSGYLGDAHRSLDGLENNTQDVPLRTIAPFLAYAQTESRRAASYSFLSQQLHVSRQYHRMMEIGRADWASGARDTIRRCDRELEAARGYVLAGRYDEAEAAYGRATRLRMVAMNLYRDRPQMTAGLSAIWDAITDPAEFWSREPDLSRYRHYSGLQASVFRGIVRGGMTQQQMESALRGTRMVEASIFAIPANADSQTFASYQDEQQAVLRHVQQGDMTAASAVIERMQQTVADHQFYTQIGLTVVGVGMLFVPGVGPLLSGSLFTTMAIDQLVQEYTVTGTTSWTSWVMLGGIIATMGLGGAAGILRAESQLAQGTAYGARMASMARGLTWAGLGIGLGFSGYMGYHAVDAFSQGHTREGIFLTAMAAFPWLHMASARGVGAMRARAARGRAEARLQAEMLMDELMAPEVREPTFELEAPTEAPSQQAARQLREPEAMFRFLRELRSSETSVRQAAEARLRTLPENMARAVGELRSARLGNLEFMSLRTALESGQLSPYARAALSQAIEQMGIGPRPEPTPPRGPRGGGPRPRGEIDSAGLLNPGGLRSLLGDLMIPDAALEGTTATAREAYVRRAAARGTLERVRAENPQLAELIDGMVRNPTLREYVETPESASALARRMWQRAEQQVRDAVPREAVEAEQRMAVGYYQDIVMMDQARFRHLRPAEGEGVMRGALDTRAMADQGGRGGGDLEGPTEPGSPPTPEQLGGGGRPSAPAGPREPLRPTPRRVARPAPEQRPVQPEEGQAEVPPTQAEPTPREVQMLRPRSRIAGAARFGYDQTVGRFLDFRASRRAAMEGRGQTTPEGTIDSVREAVEQTLDMTWDPQVAEQTITARNGRADAARTRLEQLRQQEGATQEQIDAAAREYALADAQASSLEQRLRGGPERSMEIIRALDAYARQGGDRSLAAAQLSHRMFARGNVRARIAGMAEGEGGFLNRLARRDPATRLQRDMMRALSRGAREGGMDVETYMDNLARRPMTTTDAELVVLALESARGGRPPLQLSQEVLGIEFSSAERAVLLNTLREANVISANTFMMELNVIRQRLSVLRDLPTRGRPELEGMQQGLIERAMGRGGNMDESLVELMRQQPDIENAVRDAYGEDAATAFREGTALDDVLASMRREGTAQPELLRDVEAFVQQARQPEIVNDFNALQHFGDTEAMILEAADAAARQVAAESRDLIPQVRDFAIRVGQIINRWEPFTNWGFRSVFRTGFGWPQRGAGRPWYTIRGRTWEPGALTGGPLRPFIQNAPKMVPQLIAWYMLARYGRENVYEPLVERITGARTIREGIAMAKRDFNITITEENAEWVMGGRSSEQATLVRETRDRFDELKQEIMASSGSWLPGWVPGVTTTGETLQAQQLRTLSGMIDDCERRVVEQVGTTRFSDAQRTAIQQAFRTLRDQITTQFGDMLSASQMTELQGRLDAAQEDIMEEFRDGLTGRTEEGNGMRFFTMIPRFPDASRIRPGSVESMRMMLRSSEVMIDPRRLNEVLNDGRQMDGRLREMNGLLARMRDTTEGAEAREQARTELERILQGWNIRLENVQPMIRDASARSGATRLSAAVEAYLRQEGKDSLGISDMFSFRIDDWRGRGAAVQFRDVVSELFAIDTGIMPSPLTVSRATTEAERSRLAAMGREERQYLSANPEEFEFLWTAVQEGRLPSVYVDDAIRYLQAGHTTQQLQTQPFWMSVPIRQNSFLGLLDRRAALEPSFRPVYERVLQQYRGNSAALQAFNQFSIEAIAVNSEGRITRGEAIYGDAEALARLIIANPQTALAEARRQGMVASAILGDIEPRLFAPGNSALIPFINERSDRERAGMFRWLSDRRDSIRGHALEIIREESRSRTMPGAGRPDDVYQYLDRRAEAYLANGWWVGPTPSQQAAARERRSRGRAREARPSLERQFEPRYPRRPGLEATPRRTDQPTPAEAEAQQTAAPQGLTEEQRAFYDSSQRSGALRSIIQGAVRQYVEARTSSGALTPEAQGLLDRYGPDINSDDVATRTAARERIVQHVMSSVYGYLTNQRVEPAGRRGDYSSTGVARARRLRNVWSVTRSGEGEGFSIEIQRASSLRSAVRQYITDMVAGRVSGLEPVQSTR